jgi:hypothetical protein
MIAFSAQSILFPPGGARLSTVLVFAAFLALAVKRHDLKPAVAAVAWLVGFELLFEATRRPYEWHWIIFIAFDVVGITLLARKGITPSPLLLAATLVVWAGWLATGFHVNHHDTVRFQPSAEAFNEGAKTLWGAAYFVPLVLTAHKSRVARSLTTDFRSGLAEASRRSHIRVAAGDGADG